MEVPPTSVSGLPADLADFFKRGMFDSVESMLEYFDDLDIDYGGIVIAENNRGTRSDAPIIPLCNPSNKHVGPVHNFSHENPAVVTWSGEQRSILMEKLAEEEKGAFRAALMKDDVDRWERIAAKLPRRTAKEVKAYYDKMVEDISLIEAGFVPLPDYDDEPKCPESDGNRKRLAASDPQSEKEPEIDSSGALMFDSMESMPEYFDDLDIDPCHVGIIQEENNGIMSNNSVIAEAGNNGTYDMVLPDENGTMKNNLGIIMNGKNGMMTNNRETRSVAPIIPLSNPSNKHVEPVHNFHQENPAVVSWSREEQSILMEKLAEYENEPVLKKYMKIKLLLPGKFIRDIAMRCKWMAVLKEKEQTLEEHSAERISEDKKGKKVDISQRTNDLPRQWKAEAANTTNDITVLQRAMQQTLETSNELLDQLEANVGVGKFHQQQ